MWVAEDERAPVAVKCFFVIVERGMRGIDSAHNSVCWTYLRVQCDWLSRPLSQYDSVSNVDS